MKNFQQEWKCSLQAGLHAFFYAVIAILLALLLRMLTVNSWNFKTQFFDAPYQGADKSFARPGRKQATATKL